MICVKILIDRLCVRDFDSNSIYVTVGPERATMMHRSSSYKFLEIEMTDVVIVSAARTAVGSFGGSFANVPAHDLGAAVLEALVERAGVEKSDVSETMALLCPGIIKGTQKKVGHLFSTRYCDLLP